MKGQSYYRFITIVFLCVMAISCDPKASDEEAFAPVKSVSTAEAIAKTDELCRRHDDLPKLRECLNLLGEVRDAENRNFDVEWRYARLSYFLGEATEAEKESLNALRNGAEAGRIASKIEPNKPDGYFWYGANLGEQAQRSPLTKGLTLVGDIREAMNKVIEIQPDYQNATAFDALAQIELATHLTGGKAEKAIEYLEKALAYEKGNAYIHLHLAQAYLEVGRKADAKNQLEYVLKMKPDPDYLLEYKETVKEAKKLLETRF